MKMCDRCNVPGCALNYNGKACEEARKEYCPDVVYTNGDNIRDMDSEELAALLDDIQTDALFLDGPLTNLQYGTDWAAWLAAPAKEVKT